LYILKVKETHIKIGWFWFVSRLDCLQ